MHKVLGRGCFVCWIGLVLLVIAQPAAAQRRGQAGLRLGSATPAQLLQLDEIQKELKITDEQKTQIVAVNETLTAGRRKLFAATSKDSKERGPKVAELNKQATTEVDKFLDPAQRKRLNEIVMQVNGGASLENDEVQKALAIGEDQKARLVEIRQSYVKDRHDILGPLEGPSRAAKEAELYRTTNQKMLDVMTPEQRKKFEQMQGKKIALNLLKPTGT